MRPLRYLLMLLAACMVSATTTSTDTATSQAALAATITMGADVDCSKGVACQLTSTITNPKTIAWTLNDCDVAGAFADSSVEDPLFTCGAVEVCNPQVAVTGYTLPDPSNDTLQVTCVDDAVVPDSAYTFEETGLPAGSSATCDYENTTGALHDNQDCRFSSGEIFKFPSRASPATTDVWRFPFCLQVNDTGFDLTSDGQILRRCSDADCTAGNIFAAFTIRGPANLTDPDEVCVGENPAPPTFWKCTNTDYMVTPTSKYNTPLGGIVEVDEDGKVSLWMEPAGTPIDTTTAALLVGNEDWLGSFQNMVAANFVLTPGMGDDMHLDNASRYDKAVGTVSPCDTAPPAAIVTAEAGPDLVTYAGTDPTVSGASCSGGDQGGMTYAWACTAGDCGSVTPIGNADTLTPTFPVPASDVTATIQLTCDDLIQVAATDTLTLTGFATLPSDREARCTALGSNCVCSEPLGSTKTAVGLYADPDDSSTKECPGELLNGASWFPETKATPLTLSGSSFDAMPAGSSVVTVWENTSLAGTSHITGTKSLSGVQRLCSRYYWNYSSNYSLAVGSLPSDCAANKHMEYDFNGSQGKIQMGQKGADGKWGILCNGFSLSPNNNAPRSGTLSVDDCKTQWCIVEMCLSGNIAAGTGLSIDGYMRGLTTGESLTWARFQLGNANGGGLGTNWIASMYRQNTCTGTKVISHAMQASWATDSGQTIGCSVEVEGPGC